MYIFVVGKFKVSLLLGRGQSIFFKNPESFPWWSFRIHNNCGITFQNCFSYQCFNKQKALRILLEMSAIPSHYAICFTYRESC